MKVRVKELVEQGNRLFEKRRPLLSLWQTIADNFYPERADFTSSFSLGDEFASHLMTGRPVLARRDLANSLSSMLRPRATPWFHARTDNEQINEDPNAKAWLDKASDILRRIMYDPRAQFVRATKQGDNDFAAFGQCVIQIQPNRDLDGILFMCWHLRDVAWCENSELVIDTVHRDWCIEAREYCRLFPKTGAQQVKSVLDKEPYKEIKCRHIVIPADQYDYHTDPEKKRRAAPFVSIYVDIENETILEERPRTMLDYVIPRWVTISGQQYAYSPSVVVALPDARMLQQIGLTLLEAGQKAVDPPMKAVGEMITGGVNMYAGGVTWVDAEYDERSGSALEPINIDTRGLNWGVAMSEKVEAIIQEAFFLNKINLPDLQGEKTAYEVQKLVEEYIRQALPLFEPMEVEYNGGLCEKSFELALRMGSFGSPMDIPRQLQGQDVRFQFESPLQAATERAKAQTFVQAGQLLAQAIQTEMMARQADSLVAHNYDLNRAFRDAINGVGAPAEWIRSEADAEETQNQAREIKAQADAARGQLEAQANAAAVTQQAGQAGKAVQDARVSAMQANEMQAAQEAAAV